MTVRQEKLNAQITRSLGNILRGLKDPRMGGIVSVLSVEVTKDFQFADCLLGVYGADTKAVAAAIESSAGFIRKSLAREISNIHTIPQLRFRFDGNSGTTTRVDELLEQIARERTEGSAPATNDEK